MSGRRRRKVRAASSSSPRRIGGLPVRGPASAWPRAAPPVPQVQVWHTQPCGGCGRDIAYLPAQQVNQCGWAGCPARGQPASRRP